MVAQFQTAVVKHDAKAVARDMRFPQPWENGPAIREIKSEADLAARFDVFFTTEIKKQIAAGSRSVCPTATTSSCGTRAATNIRSTSRPQEMALRWMDWAKGRLSGRASCGNLRRTAYALRGTFRASGSAREYRSFPPASVHECSSCRRRASRIPCRDRRR